MMIEVYQLIIILIVLGTVGVYKLNRDDKKFWGKVR